MRKMLLLSIWLFTVRCQQQKIHLSAREGGPVEISCKYASGYENYPKLFRKGVYGKRTTLIKTTGKKLNESTKKGKYYLRDDTKHRILQVTIRNLNLNDGGTYWCEIDANLFDPKTEIELRVYKAAPTPKPPPVASNHPLSTTVQAINRNQQQSATITVSGSASGTTLWSTPPQDTGHLPLAVPPLAGRELYLAVAAAAVLLLSLLLVFYFRLRKHRHDRARATFGHEAEPWINTCNTQLVHTEHHNRGQQRELDPSVNVSSSDSTYAAVTSRRAPGAHASICHPVQIQTQIANPGFSSSISSCLQDDASARTINQHKENVCRVSSPSAEAGDQHKSEDVRLLYSAVCFNTERGAQARGQIRSAAGPSEVYATISHHQ